MNPAAESLNDASTAAQRDPARLAGVAPFDVAITLRLGVEVFGWVGVINRTIADLMGGAGEIDPQNLRLRVLELAKIAAHLADDCANALGLVREEIEAGASPGPSAASSMIARSAMGKVPPAPMPATKGGAR